MDRSLYEKPIFLDPIFSIRISYEQHEEPGEIFQSHWHEQIELLYFTGGKALLKFNSDPFVAEPGDLLIANSNELHWGESLTENTSYYCIIIDTSALHSCFMESCDPSKINRTTSYCTLLSNKVNGDRYISKCMNILISEQEKKKPGYELAVKSSVFKLMTLLIRRHTNKTLSPQKYDSRIRNLERLNKVLEYIEESYDENITVEKACRITSLSPYYFCRLFKASTGKTLSEYVNLIRVNKAEFMLKNTDMNVTEVALNTGFNDINYFSRIFKKYKNVSPSSIRKTP
ncbi:MAG: AraC family transcriptional regulator [Clostridia bacterium]|nr:AraC family transcriptional regulator [Clostridia bacterium]